MVAEQALQPLNGQCTQVLAVNPPKLLHVKDGRRLGHPIEREGRDELIDRVDLLIRRIIPAEQAEVVDHRLGQEALQLKLVDGGSAVSLGELRAVLAEHEAEVGILWYGVPEGLEDEDLPNRVGQVLLRTDDVGHCHLGVVHRHAEVVHGHAARAQQDEVADRRRHIPRHLATDRVLDGDDLATRHLEAHRVRFAGLHPPGHLLGVGVAPGAVVLRVLTEGLCCHALFFELLGCAEARVRLASLQQLLREFLVDAALHPLGLPVRTLVAANFGTFVPDEPQPSQVGQHRLLRLACASSRIGILDTYEEVTTCLPRLQPTEEGGSSAAHVERSCWRRRKAGAHCTFRPRAGARVTATPRRNATAPSHATDRLNGKSRASRRSRRCQQQQSTGADTEPRRAPH
mmetsp:Transcript_65106/g.128758  ORF Transcript_65106/g.128758 Transcript_65106/m.128758 type:complete len:401 (+) Transcript_65106:1076-2278(+)